MAGRAAARVADGLRDDDDRPTGNTGGNGDLHGGTRPRRIERGAGERRGGAGQRRNAPLHLGRDGDGFVQTATGDDDRIGQLVVGVNRPRRDRGRGDGERSLLRDAPPACGGGAVPGEVGGDGLQGEGGQTCRHRHVDRCRCRARDRRRGAVRVEGKEVDAIEVVRVGQCDRNAVVGVDEERIAVSNGVTVDERIRYRDARRGEIERGEVLREGGKRV